MKLVFRFSHKKEAKRGSRVNLNSIFYFLVLSFNCYAIESYPQLIQERTIGNQYPKTQINLIAFKGNFHLKAQELLKNGKQKLARKKYLEIIKFDPLDSKAKLALGKIDFNNADYASSIKQADSMLYFSKDREVSANALLLKAKSIFMLKGSGITAYRLAQSAFAMDPNNSDIEEFYVNEPRLEKVRKSNASAIEGVGIQILPYLGNTDLIEFFDKAEIDLVQMLEPFRESIQRTYRSHRPESDDLCNGLLQSLSKNQGFSVLKPKLITSYESQEFSPYREEYFKRSKRELRTHTTSTIHADNGDYISYLSAYTGDVAVFDLSIDNNKVEAILMERGQQVYPDGIWMPSEDKMFVFNKKMKKLYGIPHRINSFNSSINRSRAYIIEQGGNSFVFIPVINEDA